MCFFCLRVCVSQQRGLRSPQCEFQVQDHEDICVDGARQAEERSGVAGVGVA